MNKPILEAKYPFLLERHTFMIPSFPICVLSTFLSDLFSENERAVGRMAEGKVEDKRFLVPPVAHDYLTGSLSLNPPLKSHLAKTESKPRSNITAAGKKNSF